MVKQQKSNLQKERQLSLVFRALADPTRRKILRHLARGQASVGDIANPFAQSLPAISKHLKVLEKAKLIKRSRQGRSYQLQLTPRPLKEADTFISFYERFWNNKLHADSRIASRCYRRRQSERSPARSFAEGGAERDVFLFLRILLK